MTDCVFCRIVAGVEPANIVERSATHVVFPPLAPHASGHLLFVPTCHVADAAENQLESALLMAKAAQYVRDHGFPANIITSVGAEATQTVFHLHIHVIPRGPHDGLPQDWPWLRSEH